MINADGDVQTLDEVLGTLSPTNFNRVKGLRMHDEEQRRYLLVGRIPSTVRRGEPVTLYGMLPPARFAPVGGGARAPAPGLGDTASVGSSGQPARAADAGVGGGTRVPAPPVAGELLELRVRTGMLRFFIRNAHASEGRKRAFSVTGEFL